MPFLQGVSQVQGAHAGNGARWRIMWARDSSNPHAHKRSMAVVRFRNSSHGRSLSAWSGMWIAKSHALMFQSTLLLLNAANHSYRRTRTTKDLKRVEHFRSELHRSEAGLRWTGLDELQSESSEFWLQIYADLIHCATASLDRMKSAMSSREAADQFETATDVQMLEELLAQWTSRMHVIRQRAADGGHHNV
jgi:hypothetical protein